MRRPTTIAIDTRADSVETIAPPSGQHRFEGLAFSPSGRTLGVIDPDLNAVFLYRRRVARQFDNEPFCIINGTQSCLAYPHDLSFSRFGGGECLAVGQRTGAIAVYAKNRSNDQFGSEPAFEIRGAETGLVFSDAVAFVPPLNQHIAACSLLTQTVTIYERSSARLTFTLAPAFELQHSSLDRPDGLAFSACGRWMAVGNHGNDTVSVFERSAQPSAVGVQYGPEPTTVIRDTALRYPHSVAFTPKSNHLVVTSAGANYFSIYQHDGESRWSQVPMVQLDVAPPAVFRQTNEENKMEGGPKGVAVFGSRIAVCSPQVGVKIYRYRER